MDNLTDFIKKNTLLALTPKRNSLGDSIIGWNRPALSRYERITVEQANDWLPQDVEKARKVVAKHGLASNEVCVFVAFYISRKRWYEAEHFFKLVAEGHKTKAALVLSNSKWFSINPSLGGEIASKIAKGETKL